MLDLKRGPQDPILPIRATKRPRTTALYGDRPTASQNEGLLSHWISSLVTLTHKAATGIFTEPLRGPIQRSSSSQVPRTDVVAQPSSLPAQAISLHSTHLPRKKSPKMRTKRSLPRSGPTELPGSLTTSVSTQRIQSPSSSPSPHMQQPDRTADVPSSVDTLAANLPKPAMGPIAIALPHPSNPPSTPTPGPSKSVSRALPVIRPSFRPSIPGAFLSPSLETPAPKPPYVPQTPQTEPRVEAVSNPYYRSMAPPPSPNLPSLPSPRPQPPDSVNSVESPPPSIAASTSVSTSTLTTSREAVDAAIAVAEKKLAGRVVRRVFSRKGARQHIFQTAHKARVLESRKEDQESLMQHLFELERAHGYSSDFQTFQGFVKYRELLDGKGLMSSRSLADLRGRYHEDQRRHSFGDNINPDFLERALQRARETLNGPKPPPPFIPSFEQLRIARRDRDTEINSRLRGPPLPDFLFPEDDAEVSRLLKKRGVIAKVARLQITDADLSRLKPGTWLNDEIVNFYGQLILERSEGNPRHKGMTNGARSEKNKILNVHYFNSFFFEKLSQEGYEKARLAKWTKKFDLFSKDIALLPINHGNSHWTAAAINFRRRRIESFDSMGARRQDIFALLREYVGLEHINKKSKPFDWTGWIDYCPRDTPQQENGYDCGVFTCQFLEALSRGMDSPFNFTQRSMAFLRRRMILEIGRTELLGGT